MTGRPVPAGERPFLVGASFHTADLPETPQRTYRVPASAWLEAPEDLLTLGDELGQPVEYKRRIGRFLLWRAGPPVGEARYLAVDAADPTLSYRFELAGKSGSGLGPDGVEHARFRSWKESLLAVPDRGSP
ncbi:MAG: hypothetical protein R6X29_11005 [Acidimicrobiia bacterium]|jgi:hypothetical protein